VAMNVVYANIGGRINCESRAGTVSHYVPDCHGSTIALMDQSGVVTDTYDYWSYGEERVHTGSSVTGFTFLGALGYVKDMLNKLYYVRARHLRPELARWQTIDPLWPTQSPYAYVDCAPMRDTDSTGLWCSFSSKPLYGSPKCLTKCRGSGALIDEYISLDCRVTVYVPIGCWLLFTKVYNLHFGWDLCVCLDQIKGLTCAALAWSLCHWIPDPNGQTLCSNHIKAICRSSNALPG